MALAKLVTARQSRLPVRHYWISQNTVNTVFTARVRSCYECCFMSYLRSLQQLRQQFEELTDNLDVCHNPVQRRELLKRMKILIEETDKLISAEVLNLNSMPDQTNPP